MMFEYDRMCRFSRKPAWLRVFLFPVPINNNKASFDSLASIKSLNSVQVSPFEEYSSPPTTPPPPSMATKDTVTKAEMKKFRGLHVMNDEFEDILKFYLTCNFSKAKEFHGLHVVNDEFEDILKSFWKCCFLKPNVVL
ncbi:hypothetical protein MTR_5g088160 [Medicago truncatula]|uniref:Uncharacterized protein n=1 Tax=Medicago truncatula TaxID=3880 RepID=G7K7N9_MEDTR|nr:hypothetical protein MTR_5g088160 [Medicago truncatula]